MTQIIPIKYEKPSQGHKDSYIHTYCRRKCVNTNQKLILVWGQIAQHCWFEIIVFANKLFVLVQQG